VTVGFVPASVRILPGRLASPDRSEPALTHRSRSSTVAQASDEWTDGLSGNLRERMDQLERRVLLAAMQRHHGNKSRAANELGLSRVGLRAKLARHGLADDGKADE